MIQTTAPASPGSSGGPLLNRGGYVVGILTSSVVNGQNLNFAIPINYAKGILETLSVSTPRPARLLVGPKINPDPPITENPKEVISAAKTIIVRQIAGNPEFLLSVEKELRSWKRFSLVNDSQYADLILDISPTSEIDVMAGKGARAIGILTTRRGSRLWSTVKGGDFSLTGLSTSSVGKAIVQELRKFVERERRPR